MDQNKTNSNGRRSRRPAWQSVAAFCLLAGLAGESAARELRVGVDGKPPETVSDQQQAPQTPSELRNALAALAGLGLLLAGGVLLLRRQVRARTRELLAVNRQLEATLNAVPDLLFEVDLDGRYLDVRATRADQLAAPAESLLGRGIREVLPAEAAEVCLAALQEANEQGRSSGRQIQLSLPQGPTWFELSVSKKASDAEEPPRFIVLSRDVTDRKQSERHVQQLAHFDPLTGLPNRSLLRDRFRQALSRAQRHGEPLAVMFLDLDHFKGINNGFGHEVGDQLLREVAQRLREQLRAEDSAARIGGDEFFLLLPDTDVDGAARTATRLQEAIARPYLIGQHEIRESVSIGIAMYPQNGTDMDTLSRHADAAMYQVKHDSRNGFRFFTPEMQARSARAAQLAGALHQALAGQQFSLHYQPQVSLQDGRVIGAEALLRWEHPQLGAVSPADFIPIAESSGLILQLGEWVLRQAIGQARHWMDLGLPPLAISVNLSAAQFRHPDLPQLVARIIGELGLPPDRLELELTESVTMNDPQTAARVVDRLSEHGIRMAIDDFGTGYSSLGYLKRLQVHKLKIDQSFVHGICEDPDDKAIVCAIIQLARSLALRTVAEGVETAGQLDFLRREGCDEVQGYYLSQPMTAEAFEAHVRHRMAAPQAAFGA